VRRAARLTPAPTALPLPPPRCRAAGLIGCSGVRLPLVGLAADSDAKLSSALKGAGLL
jgi:hypothetical protein